MIVEILIVTQIIIAAFTMAYLHSFRRKHLEFMGSYAEFGKNTALAMANLKEAVSMVVDTSSSEEPAEAVNNNTLAYNQSVIDSKVAKLIDVCEYITLALNGNNHVYVLPSARSKS